jgi:hypothetical protein
MSNQELFVTEDHVTWRQLSNGDIILPGHRLWDQRGQPPRAPQPSGPRTILRAEFDALPQEEQWKTVREGIRVVDPGEDERRAKAARVAAELAAMRGPEIKRARFDSMTPAERSQVIAEGARIVD